MEKSVSDRHRHSERLLVFVHVSDRPLVPRGRISSSIVLIRDFCRLDMKGSAVGDAMKTPPPTKTIMCRFQLHGRKEFVNRRGERFLVPPLIGLSHLIG